MRFRIHKLVVSSAFFMILLDAGQLAAQTPARLSLQDAKTMALANHPQVLAAQAATQAAGQQIVESRAGYYPILDAEVTGSAGNDNSRIGAGALSASRLFNRFGQGLVLSQLITDSGRTPNLVQSSRLQAEASNQNYQATRYDVILQVTRSYFDVLRSQALVRVAEETVSARQLLLDQVTTLANNNLRSQLDVSFADVNVSQAKLLLLSAQNAVQSAYAELARSLGTDQATNYQLVDEPFPQGPPPTSDPLIAQAYANRPELASFANSRDAAYKFAQAETDLARPTVSLLGAAGYLPFITQEGTTLIPNHYEGAAVNLEIPVFNGHLFAARRETALYQANEADQRLRDEQERVARDVRVAWANAQDSFQSIDVTAQFLRQAALALDLANGRYQIGLASIVELTQAQLNETQAEIQNLNAKYDYQIQNAALQYALGLLR